MLFLQNYLASCKIAFAFLSIGSDTLFGIFALETQLLQLALDCQRLGECDLGTRLHRAFNATDGLGSAVGRAEAACILNDLFPVVQRLIGMQAKIVLEAERDSIEHTDFRARAKELIALAAHDNDMHIIIEARP